MIKRQGWNVFIITIALITGIALSLKPWRLYRDQRLKADSAVGEMRASEKDRATLLQKRAIGQSPVGKEEAARKNGYHKADEIPIEAFK